MRPISIFKKLVLGIAACALAIAPFRFAAAQGAHGASGNGTLTPFICIFDGDAFAGFVNFVTHGLHFVVLQASIGSDSDSASGGFITVPGQLFTGFGFDIDHCYSEDTEIPIIFVTGDDDFGDAVFAGYLCDDPTTQSVVRTTGFLRKFWAPDQADFGSGIPTVSNTIVITLFTDRGTPVTVNINNVRANGRAVLNNLRGLQGCSVFNGTDF